jgi:hypothetical protein
MSLPITDIKDNVEHLDQPSLNDVAFTPGSVEEKRLVRKIDRRVLPILWVMVSGHVYVPETKADPRARHSTSSTTSTVPTSE